MFQELFKEVSQVFQEALWIRNFKETFKGVSRKYHGCFMEDSRIFEVSFHGVLKEGISNK